MADIPQPFTDIQQYSNMVMWFKGGSRQTSLWLEPLKEHQCAPLPRQQRDQQKRAAIFLPIWLYGDRHSLYIGQYFRAPNAKYLTPGNIRIPWQHVPATRMFLGSNPSSRQPRSTAWHIYSDGKNVLDYQPNRETGEAADRINASPNGSLYANPHECVTLDGTGIFAGTPTTSKSPGRGGVWADQHHCVTAPLDMWQDIFSVLHVAVDAMNVDAGKNWNIFLRRDVQRYTTELPAVAEYQRLGDTTSLAQTLFGPRMPK